MDSIADMFNSINTAQAVSKQQISVPFSNFKMAILDVLKKEGYIEDFAHKGKIPDKRILINLKYNKEGKPAIAKIRKISKQGQRIYASKSELRPVKSGYGISIISSSRGLLTNKEARKNNMGGELICEVY